MEGIFPNLYLVLQAKLQSITNNSAQVLKLIVEDTGQLADEVPDLQYPCMIINMDDIRFYDLAQNVQIGEVNVVFKLVTDVYSGTSNIAPLATKEKGLNYMAVESLVHKSMQGYCPSDDLVPVTATPMEAQPLRWSDTFGSLDRVSARTNKQYPLLRIRELTYSIGFQDYSTLVTPTLTPATIVIADEITIPTTS